jgi:hypothetical protein
VPRPNIARKFVCANYDYVPLNLDASDIMEWNYLDADNDADIELF